MNDGQRRLGEYRLLEKLGSGGMGTVWRAEAGGRAVALKILHPHLVDVPGFFQRFQREAELGRSVDHPNIVRVLGADLLAEGDEIRCLIVMELVEGRTLRALLDDLGRVPEGLLRELARQVVDGLAAIHRRGIVHRDLKPENIVVTDDNRVRIMDLGVARLPDSTLRITKEGSFAGSTLYASPEQLRGEEVGPAADLYSLGVCLYEMASGTNPFRRQDVGAVIHSHLNVEPPALRSRAPGASVFLEELVAWLLAKDPSGRPDSGEILRPVLGEMEESAWWSERRGRPEDVAGPGPPTSVRRDARLHGRDADLEQIEAAWSEAWEGRGRVVLVTGEAGIGKTRLVDEFLRRRDADRAHRLYGSYAPGSARGGLSASLDDWIGARDPARLLGRYLGGNEEFAGAFAERIRPGTSGGASVRPDPGAIREAWRSVLAGMAAERPVLWVLEDLHLAPAESREIVLSLARQAEEGRALILLTSRPGLDPETLEAVIRMTHARHRSLERLSPRQVVLMLRDILSADWLADRLGTRIAYKSDGVPFVILEILDMLAEAGHLDELLEQGEGASVTVPEIEIPTAVRDLISARLKRVRDEERRLLEMAAVQGHRFDTDLVARVAGIPRVRALERLAAVERRTNLLRSDGDGMRFDHHLVTEVVSERTMAPLAREYHTLLADHFAEREGLDPERPEDAPGAAAVFLATHYLSGVKPERAEPWALPAVRHLEREYRYEPMMELAEAAFRHRDTLSAETTLAIAYCEVGVLTVTGRREGARRRVREGREIAEAGGRPLHRAWSRGLEARLDLEDGEHRRARELLLEAEEIARESDEDRALVFVLLNLGNVEYYAGRTDRANRCYRECAGIAERVGDRGRRIVALGNLAHGRWHAGEIEEGRRGYDRVIREAREAGDLATQGQFQVQLGELLTLTGEIDEGRKQLRLGIETARRILARRTELGGLQCLATAHLLEGRLDDAERAYRDLLPVAEKLGDWLRQSAAWGNLGLVHLYRGEFPAAREATGNQERIAMEATYRLGMGMAAGGRSLIRAAMGEIGRALEKVDRKIELCREAGFVQGTSAGQQWKARLLWLLGSPEAAESLLDVALESGREAKSPRDVAACLGWLGALAGQRGDDDRAGSRFARAIEEHRRVRDGLGLADTLAERGRWLAERDPDGGRRDLEEAAALAGESGRPDVLLDARVELLRLGVGSAGRVLVDLRDAAPGIPVARRMILLHHLSKILGDPSLGAEAAGLLDRLVEGAPAEYRESMVARVPLHREIADRA